MSVSNLEMFKKSDQEKAAKELLEYEYSMLAALDHVANAEFSKAAVHNRNIANTLDNLAILRNAKVMHDQAEVMLENIDAEQIRRHYF